MLVRGVCAEEANVGLNTRPIRVDINGNLMTMPAAPLSPIMVTVSNTESDWSFTGASNIVNTAPMEAAAIITGKTHFIRSMQFINLSLIAAELRVLSGGVLIWRGQANASMTGMASIVFATPLQGVLGGNITVQLGVTGTNTIVNMQGYVR